jgi:hypothetical protein
MTLCGPTARFKEFLLSCGLCCKTLRRAKGKCPEPEVTSVFERHADVGKDSLGGRYGLLPRSSDLILLPGQLPPGEQAAAIPPDSSIPPDQKQSVVPALKVGFEIAYVSARCREAKVTSRRGASILGLVAVLEACLATIGAIAAGSLKLFELRHERTRRRGWRPGSCLSERPGGRRCPANRTSVCRLLPPMRWSRHLFRRYDRDAGKRGSGARCGLQYRRAV